MKYLKLFENFDSEDLEMDTIKNCLDIFLPRLMFPDLFHYDKASWFITVFTSLRTDYIIDDIVKNAEKYGIKSRNIDQDLANKFLTELSDKWGTNYNDRFVFMQWWGWYYDNAHVLGMLDKIDKDGKITKNVLSRFGDQIDDTKYSRIQKSLNLSLIEMDAIGYIRSREVRGTFDPEFKDEKL